MPLCDTLDCVHHHNEGFHRSLLSLRGPLASDFPEHIDPRVSFFRLALAKKLSSLSLSHATFLGVF